MVVGMRERVSILNRQKMMSPLGFATESSRAMEGVADKFSTCPTLSKSSQGNAFLVSSGFGTGTVADGDLWNGGTEKKSSLSSFSWSKSTDLVAVNADASRQSVSLLTNGVSDGAGPFLGVDDANVFSSSLPSLFHEKLNLSSSVGQSLDTESLHLEREGGDEQLVSLEEMESQTIGDLLPGDEEELLAGIADGFDFLSSLNCMEEPEDFDLFSSGGGLEMDCDSSQEGFGMLMNNHMGLDSFPGSMAHHGSSNGSGSVIGEHPYGEHPSRTLFVRNINSNVEDSELRTLFEQYGAIRTLYTACKHRGFVMISYYDIRAARSAMRALQNKPLRRRKLDIHFSIPKDNPSDKDINQGTLVVFNLDASVSNDDLRQIFGVYGEVKEIRETPHKRHHKFIEFYDVRAAEAALRALNRSDIAGKRIKLEPSRPGGARRSLMQQLSQELEQEETRAYRQHASSPITNSPPGYPPLWGQIGSPVHNGSMRGIHHSIGLGLSVSCVSKTLAGISPSLSVPPLGHVGTIGSHLERNNSMDGSHSPGPANIAVKSMPAYHPHSFPEGTNGFMPFYSPAAPVAIRGGSVLPGSHEGIEGMHLPRVTNDAGNVSLFEHAPGAVGVSGSGSMQHLSSSSSGGRSLSGLQFLWGNNTCHYQHTVHSSPPIIWSTSAMGHTFNPGGHGQPQMYGVTGTHSRFVNTILPSHGHHVGSAPPGDPSVLERHFGYLGESPDTPFLGPCSLGPVGGSGSNGSHVLNMGGGCCVVNPGAALGSNGGFESSLSPSLGVMSPRPRGHIFQTGGTPVFISGTSDGLSDRGRIRRTETGAAQTDNKKQYQLDIDRILRGEDTRTTLMIKNIPNKYTSKMLLAAIDENHHGTYDFLYLPIDFKNKCNVGYAFINMTAPQHIIPFYQAFNGKKWEKFNSEKVASLAYARIQGKAALIAHFQNSSLMNEDKRCRPILFHSDGPDAGDQEPFPLGVVNIRARVARDRNGSADFPENLASSNKDESASGSVGSSTGGMVPSSPEKD